jgi:hypothetical protein
MIAGWDHPEGFIYPFSLYSIPVGYVICIWALHNAAKKWTMPIKDWRAALNQFALFFGERVPLL